jgi:hypothetical protein
VQGDKAWVESKFEELTSKEIAIVGEKPQKVEGIPETLVEFLESKGNPRKHSDIAAVFAYWVLKVEKEVSFNVKDLSNLYDRTRTTKPANLNDVLYKNIKRHVFAEAKKRKDGYKACVITRKGEEHVEQMK